MYFFEMERVCEMLNFKSRHSTLYTCSVNRNVNTLFEVSASIPLDKLKRNRYLVVPSLCVKLLIFFHPFL